MSSNYEMIKRIITDDYYKCIGTFRNCVSIYDDISKVELLTEEGTPEYHMLKGRKEDLLSNLGKVGEKALKYIIGLELLRTNPNIDLKSFEEFFRKQGPLKTFAMRHGVQLDDKKLNKLLQYHDANNQKAHNFDYWFSVLELTMPDVVSKFKEFVYFCLQSNSIKKYCEKYGYDDYIFEEYIPHNSKVYRPITPELYYMIFPFQISERYSTEWKTRYGEKKEVTTNRLLKMERSNIRICGDVFTRLRYAANNLDNKEYPLEKLYQTMIYFVFFIQLIHTYNDDLDFDVILAFAKHQIIIFKDVLETNIEDINLIFDNYVNSFEDALHLFSNHFSFYEITRFINVGVDKKDFKSIPEDSKLNSRIVETFYSKGIYDIYEMCELLDDYLNRKTSNCVIK